MTHNDFNETNCTFIYNNVSAKIESAANQIQSIETNLLNDKKLAKKIEKLAKLMNEANMLSSEIYNKILTY